MSVKVINQETVQLTELFAATAQGDVITWAMMSEKIGRDISSCKWHVQSAMRRALAIHNVVLAPVKNEGYRRLNDNEVPGFSSRRLRRIRNTAKRGIKELSAVNYTALSDNSKVEHNLQMSLLAAVTYSTDSNQVKKLRGAVQSTGLCLPVPNVLDAVK